jgi:hypothetical protein
VTVPDDLASLLAEEAVRQPLNPNELAARVMAEHLPTEAEVPVSWLQGRPSRSRWLAQLRSIAATMLSANASGRERNG